MGCTTNSVHGENHVFPQEQLLAIRPRHTAEWMNPKVHGRAAACVPGVAGLWQMMDPSGSCLPEELVNRVKAACALHSMASDLGPRKNPVLKVPVAVSGEDGALIIDELGGDVNAENNPQNAVPCNPCLAMQEMRSLRTQVAGQKRKIES